MILFLKIAVVFMGVLIVGGLAVIGVKIYQKSNEAVEHFSAGTEDTPAAQTAPSRFSASLEHLDLGPDAEMQSMVAEGDRLVLRIRNDRADERLVIIDMNSGAVLGEIALPSPAR